VAAVALLAAGAWAVYRTLDKPEGGPPAKAFKIREAKAVPEPPAAAGGNGAAPVVPPDSDSGDTTPLPPGLTPTAPQSSQYLVGRLEAKAVSESSGIVASRKHPGVFWTHNDSGNSPEIFAVDKSGKLLARYTVDEENIDWEDIAIDDEGHLYIGDIGNNNEARKHAFVYRLDEPDPARGDPGGRGEKLKPTATWKLKYPGGRDGRFDAESLFVWKGRGYVISKLLTLRYATIYGFDLDPQRQASSKKKKDDDDGDPRETLTLEPVAEIPIRYPVTGADISVDGSRLAVVTVGGPYVLRIDGDVKNAARSKPAYFPYINPKEEAICFTDGGVLLTTEDRDILLFPDKLFEGATLPGAGSTTKPAP
jgi:hypothetical protein